MFDQTDVQLRYFFDPLCGWCYASAPAVAALAERYGPALQMMPSGLFMDPRPISDMADHAWRNDQRISSLTGQPFTELYRDNVLHAPGGTFDSTALTKTLVALGQIDPALEPRFLRAAQIERYVNGKDMSVPEVVAQVAVQVAASEGIELDADEFAARLSDDAVLAESTRQRVSETHIAMRALPSRGVPQMMLLYGDRVHPISSQELYSGGDTILSRIETLTTEP